MQIYEILPVAASMCPFVHVLAFWGVFFAIDLLSPCVRVSNLRLWPSRPNDLVPPATWEALALLCTEHYWTPAMRGNSHLSPCMMLRLHSPQSTEKARGSTTSQYKGYNWGQFSNINACPPRLCNAKELAVHKICATWMIGAHDRVKIVDADRAWVLQ